MIKLNLTDISVGDFVEIKKKMTLDMVKSFASISEDFNPIHLDEKYAVNSRYKRRVVHGLIAVSLFSGLFGTKMPGEGCVYKSQNIRFKRVIYIGDVVMARVEVTHVSIKKKLITFTTCCFVNGKVMIEGESEIFAR
jgi:3-hydroxybutyryl-CoA dehydratase